MLNETIVTVRGYLANDVIVKETSKGKISDFRVGVNSGYFNKKHEYVEEETSWYQVIVWGKIGENVARSIKRGMPVIVRGKLSISSWKDDKGIRRARTEILADSVGVDLSQGTVVYTKQIPPSAKQKARIKACNTIAQAADTLSEQTLSSDTESWEYNLEQNTLV